MMRLLCILTLFLAPVSLLALYANRKPNAQEQKAIDKYVQIRSQLLDKFHSDDWVETIDYSVKSPTLNPVTSQPMDIDELMRRTYHVRPGSQRDLKIIAPQQKKAEQLKDPTERQIAAARVEDLRQLQVEVRCNVADAAMASGPDAKIDLKIPGATF